MLRSWPLPRGLRDPLARGACARALDAFAPDVALAARLPDALVAGRGVVPFARLGDQALVALLSPHDADLRRRVGEALGMKVRFYLADPSAVEAAVERLHPADTKA